MQRHTMRRLEMTKPLEDLRREDNLFDITLVCEGGQVKAHKLMLQSSSVFFREVFAANPTLPLMYLRGVDRSHMVCLLDFMYQRYVDVGENDLESFLELGKDLKVKDDIFRSDHVQPSQSFRRPSMAPPNAYLRRPRNESPRRKRKYPEEMSARNSHEGSDYSVVPYNQEVEEGPRYKCKLRECRYRGDKANVYLHMEKKHNFSLTAQQREIIDDASTYRVGGREARRFVTPEVATNRAVYDNMEAQGEQFYADEEEPEFVYTEEHGEQFIADEEEQGDGCMEEQGMGSVIEMGNAEDVDNESRASSFKMPSVPPPPARKELFITRNAEENVGEEDDDNESLTSTVIASKAVLIPGVKGRKRFRCVETDCSFIESRPSVFTHWEQKHSKRGKNLCEDDDDKESLTSAVITSKAVLMPGVKGRKRFRCVETDCSFVESRPSVLTHWEEKHNTKKKVMKGYECTICHTEHLSPKHLSEHMENLHPEETLEELND